MAEPAGRAVGEITTTAAKTVGEGVTLSLNASIVGLRLLKEAKDAGADVAGAGMGAANQAVDAALEHAENALREVESLFRTGRAR